MTVPDWITSALDEFGRAAGLGGLSLGESGAASLAFANGARLRFEYAYETLTVMMTTPMRADDEEGLKRLLALAHPDARHPFKLRAGHLAKRNEAVLAVRLPEREVSRMSLETVFQGLWNGVERLKG